MVAVYIFIFGLALLAAGLLGILRPLRVFEQWKRLISHRFFFLHGALLIALGLPLTCNNHSVTGHIIFTIGIIVVFTGPFILLYATRVRQLFLTTTAEMNPVSIRRMIYFDAGVRIAVGALFVINYFF